MINIIAAISENNVIGKNGKIPWYIPEDLKSFKKITESNVVIMGRKTYESIGRPLPGRINIVVTNTLEKCEGFYVCNSLEKGLEYGKTFADKEIFLCGGERIYKDGMKYSDRLYITKVKGNYDGDAFFPHINNMDFSLELTKKITDDADLLVYRKK